MNRTVHAVLAAYLLALSASAWAQAPGETQARKLEEAVRTYAPEWWSRPGLLSVKPDGDRYRLVLDTGKALAPRIVPWTVKEATPLAFNLAQQADGRWVFDTSGDLRLATEQLAANRSNALSLVVASKSLSGVFDPAIVFPRSAKVDMKDATLVMRSSQDSIKLAIEGLRLNSATKDLPEGFGDVDADFMANGLEATFGTFPNPEVKLSVAKVEGTYRLGNLDLAGVGAITRFWKVTAAGKDVSDLTPAERNELKEILRQHLPILGEIGGTLAATGLSMSQGGKAFTLEKLDYQSRWEGMADRATLVIGARLANAAVAPGVWPNGFEAVLPEAAVLDLRLSGFDMGALWKDAALVRTEKELALLPRDHSSKLAFPDGKVTLDVKEGSAQSSFYDLTISGQVRLSMTETSLPAGTLRVTARDFDGTVKYLQDNTESVPVFGQASFFALMMKGLGKAQPDGSLLWDVTFDGSGKVAVNGQPLPM